MPNTFTVPDEPTERPLPGIADGDDAPDETFTDSIAIALGAIRSDTDLLYLGEIDVDTWSERMERNIAEYHTAAYLVGRDVSGEAEIEDELTSIGRTKLSAFVAVQLAHVRNFRNELLALPEGVLPDTERARADMYGQSVGGSWWRGRTGNTVLPAYPRDGTTNCLFNCCCEWDISNPDDDGVVFASWILGFCRHCPQCPERAREWGPLRLLPDGTYEPDVDQNDRTLFR